MATKTSHRSAHYVVTEERGTTLGGTRTLTLHRRQIDRSFTWWNTVWILVWIVLMLIAWVCMCTTQLAVIVKRSRS